MTPIQQPSRVARSIARTGLAAFATLVLLAPAPASATPASNGRHAVFASLLKAVDVTDDSRISAPVRAKVESHRTRARAAWNAGHGGDARREFMAAARLLSAAGQLATTELYSVATLAIIDNKPRAAAEAMDMLAADARTFGEPLVQAKALLEAATQHAASRRWAEAQDRLDTLRLLLGSSHIPDSFRAEVNERVGA